MNLFQLSEYFRFYRTAVTKYQLHSPFVFELACAILEDDRWYYAFRDIEKLRMKMLTSDVVVNLLDLGSGSTQGSSDTEQKRSVKSIARQSSSSIGQGQMLFRLANYLRPNTLLELGTSLGIGAMYLASACRESTFITLEGSPEVAHVARLNLDLLGLSKNTLVKEGPFDLTLKRALQTLQKLDLVFLDGNHRQEPTIRYFEECLAFSHEKTVFVFDDAHWSAGMASAWQQLKNHPRVTLSLDLFELSLIFIDPDFREKQHFNLVPARLKPWRFM